MALTVHVIECTSDPALAPTAIGQHWVNTTSGDQWFSNGTASVANWIPFDGVGDHGALTGLGDDDHTQYLNETRHDALPADNPHSVTAAQVGASATGHTHTHASTTGQTANDHHNELHTVASHSDTTATGAELNTLTDGSNADALHAHAGGGSDFGTYQQYEESDWESSTTSTSSQTKVTLTTPSLPSGDYRIAFCYEWKGSDTGDKVIVDVVIDGSEFNETKCEPESNSAWVSEAGFKKFSNISGVKVFKIRYKNEKSGDTARIRRARLEFWRMS